MSVTFFFNVAVKDKAEILLQVDESQSIKNELTLQVKKNLKIFLKNTISDQKVRKNVYKQMCGICEYSPSKVSLGNSYNAKYDF